MQRRILQLADGRKLSYLLYNVSGSQPAGNCIHFHGWPSSALEASILAGPVNAAGLNLACFDRPGYGESTVDANLSYHSVVGDTAQLMDALGWSSTLLCGISGGGPYASACAALLPSERVSGLLLVAAMTHTCGPGSADLMDGIDWGNRAGYVVVNYTPWVSRVSLALGSALVRHMVLPLARRLGPQRADASSIAAAPAIAEPPAGAAGPGSTPLSPPSPGSTSQPPSPPPGTPHGSMLKEFAFWATTQGMAPADKAALRAQMAAGTSAGGVVRGMLQAVFGAPGYGEGLYQDMRLTSRPWRGFELRDITCPTLVVQGTADVNVSVGMARYLAAHIPGAGLPALAPLREEVLAVVRAAQGGPPGVAAGLADVSTPPPKLGAGGHVQAPGGTEGSGGEGAGAPPTTTTDPDTATRASHPDSPPPPGLVLVPDSGHLSLGLDYGQAIMRAAAKLPALRTP